MPHARATLALVVVVEVAAAAALVPEARARPVPLGHLVRWLDTTPMDQVVVSLATWAGVLVAGWLLAATTLGLGLAAAEPAGPVRVVLARVTPSIVRRLCVAALAPTLSAASLPAVALEAPLPPPIEVSSDDAADADVAEPPTGPDAPGPLPGADDSPGQGSTSRRDPLEPLDGPSGPAVTVVPGDNLWLITARHLAAARDVPCASLPDADIADVWRLVVRENLPRLRSGDPDLIFPGESVVLPSG